MCGRPKQHGGKVHTSRKKWSFLLQFWNKLGKYKNFGVQIIQEFLILTEKLNILLVDT
jgi:hypothetical protein